MTETGFASTHLFSHWFTPLTSQNEASNVFFRRGKLSQHVAEHFLCTVYSLQSLQFSWHPNCNTTMLLAMKKPKESPHNWLGRG
jgi:hypothetical protein